MKAIRQIGWVCTIRFGVYTLARMLMKMLPFPPVRNAILRRLGAQIGRNVIIHNAMFINAHKQGFKALSIGENCFLGDAVLVDLAGPVALAKDVTIAPRVCIFTHLNVGYKDHPLQPYFPSKTSPVILERGCFIGTNSTILAGVRVGACAFVAAGAVVTKDVPLWTLVAGVPAKVSRKIQG